MKVIKYLLIICLFMASSLPLVGMDAHAQTDAIEDCFICEARPATVDLRAIFNCADAHPQRICEQCSTNFRNTQQNVGDHGFREWVCPLCRAPKIGAAPVQAPAPRPAAPHAPQPRHAQPAHHFHHNNPGNFQDDVRIGITREGKTILLMAAIGTIYFAAKYIYNRFKASEKTAKTADDGLSEFEFDDACPAKVIASSDVDSWEVESDVSIDEDWFN